MEYPAMETEFNRRRTDTEQHPNLLNPDIIKDKNIEISNLREALNVLGESYVKTLKLLCVHKRINYDSPDFPKDFDNIQYCGSCPLGSMSGGFKNDQWNFGHADKVDPKHLVENESYKDGRKEIPYGITRLFCIKDQDFAR